MKLSRRRRGSRSRSRGRSYRRRRSPIRRLSTWLTTRRRSFHLHPVIAHYTRFSRFQ